MIEEIQIKEQIFAAMRQVLKKDAAQFTGLETFEELGIDTLDKFELILKLEDIFMIEISDDDAEKLNSTQFVMEYILQKVRI